MTKINNINKYINNGSLDDITYCKENVAKALNYLSTVAERFSYLEERNPEWNMQVKYSTEQASAELAYVLAALVTWWDDPEESAEET